MSRPCQAERRAGLGLVQAAVAVGLQVSDGFLERQRFAIEIALQDVTAQTAKKFTLYFSFHPFRNQLQAQAVPQGDGCCAN